MFRDEKVTHFAAAILHLLMESQLKSITVRSPGLRLLVVIPVMLVLIGSWYVVRWQLGATMAEFAPGVDEGGLDTALASVNLAPDDPLTHFAVANLEESDLSPDRSLDGVKQYREAVRLSPNDYRLWISLGQSLETTGEDGDAERCLSRAIQLAPSYAYPHWYLGNFLIRKNRFEPAFAHLRIAGDADTSLRPQILSLAWHAYPDNVELLNRAVGTSSSARTALMGFLLEHGRGEAALQIWSEFTPPEKKEARTAGESLIGSLISKKNYRAALELFRGLKADGEPVPIVGQISNGGFEAEPELSETNPFAWQLRSNSLAQVALDITNRHSGARSLRIIFNARGKLDFNQISQLVVVQPASLYRLDFYVRSRKLISAETPRVEVIDGKDEHSVLALSSPASTGDSDWQLMSATFKTQPTSEAVVVRIGRAACEGDVGCPIYGTVWYDDFNLQRSGGNASPAESNPPRSGANI